jgi:hypothetical protein
MRGDIDLERPKRGITMPVVVDEVPFWLASEMWQEGGVNTNSTTHSTSTSGGTTTSANTAQGYTAREGEDPEQRTMTESAGEANISTSTDGYATTESEARNWSRGGGRSQTLRSVREERPTQTYSLEECLHLAMLKLRQLPKRIAVMKGDRKRTIQFKTADVSTPLDVLSLRARFRALIAERSEYLLPYAAAMAEIEERHAALGINMKIIAAEPPPFEEPRWS